MTVTKHYTKFKRFWGQLLNYKPLPQCSCGAMKLLNALHNKAYVMRFLMGLNENFETLRSQVLTYDPFPSMSKVYSLVLQEESHKTFGHGGSNASQNDVVAMYANSKSNSRNTTWNKGNGKKERPSCAHYNIPGHTIEKCYKIHGYPLGYKPKGKGNATANQVSSNLRSGAENSSTRSNLCPISKAQCEQLLAYLNTGFGVGNAHHATIVRASSVVGVEGNPSGALEVNIAQPQSNLASCSNVMAGITPNIPYTPNLSRSIFSAKIVNRNVFSKSN